MICPRLTKVLIAGKEGFELAEGDQLVELPLPPDTGTHVGKVVEMPVSHLAVVVTDKTVLALEAADHWSSIEGSDRLDYLQPGRARAAGSARATALAFGKRSRHA